jgi:Anaphase-promoting complex APC subunit CDC26
MIRVTPTKLQLKAEDLTEYDRHKASWNAEGAPERVSAEKLSAQDDAAAHRNAVRARLGIKLPDGSSK